MPHSSTNSSSSSRELTLSPEAERRLHHLYQRNIIHNILLSLLERGPMHILFYLSFFGTWIEEIQEEEQFDFLKNELVAKLVNAGVGIVVPSIFFAILYYTIKAYMNMTVRDIDNKSLYPEMALERAITSSGIRQLAEVKPSNDLARAWYQKSILHAWMEARRNVKLAYFNQFSRTISSSTILTNLLELALPNLSPWRNGLCLSISALVGLYSVLAYRESRRLYHCIEDEVHRVNTPTEALAASPVVLNRGRLVLSASNYFLYGAAIGLLWLEPLLNLIHASPFHILILGLAVALWAGLLSALDGWRYEELQHYKLIAYKTQFLPIAARFNPDLNLNQNLRSIRWPRNADEWISVFFATSWVIYLAASIDNFLNYSLGHNYLGRWEVFASALVLSFLLSAIEQLMRLPREAYIRHMTQGLMQEMVPPDIDHEFVPFRPRGRLTAVLEASVTPLRGLLSSPTWGGRGRQHAV